MRCLREEDERLYAQDAGRGQGRAGPSPQGDQGCLEAGGSDRRSQRWAENELQGDAERAGSKSDVQRCRQPGRWEQRGLRRRPRVR